MEVTYNGYLISDNKEKVNRQVVLDYLARSYWANARPLERILKSIENSVCYGVYHDGQQVGFARVITDGATTYYLCDVFVLESHRGQGIGKKLVETIVNLEDYDGMVGVLATLDAHGLYEQYGFVRNPDRYMVRRKS